MSREGSPVKLSEEKLARAAVTYEGTFTSQRVQHAALETHGGLAWVDAKGVLNVRSSTQVPFLTRRVLCEIYDLPSDKVRVFCDLYRKNRQLERMNAELEQKIPGVVWNFSQNIRDNVMEALSGIKGDNSVKIFGPDLDKLEELTHGER